MTLWLKLKNTHRISGVTGAKAVVLWLLVMFNLVVFCTAPVTAEGVQPDRVVLMVEYQDGSDREGRKLTLADIMTLPKAGFTTSTIWTEGTQHFEGVWLKDLVNHIEVDGGLLELSALNEYLVDFTVADIATSEALVAYRHNGKLMSPRMRGPLWVVFPYDKGPEFRTEPTYVASIWQLDLMIALP